MIRRLIILLLIVGCAPTTANFYIGMTEKEFIQQNNLIMNEENIVKRDRITGDFIKVYDQFQRTDFSQIRLLSEKDENRVMYKIDEKLSSYYFNFYNDTLATVYRGKWNSVWEKEIDYSKYPNSKPK